MQNIIELLFGLGTFMMFSVISLIASLIAYLLTAYPLYKMYKLAGLKNPGVAFIPIIGSLKAYNLANLSSWCFLINLLGFIPILGTIVIFLFNVYVDLKICQNFGLDIFVCVLSIFFSPFIYWYIALTNRPFIGFIDSKYKENRY